MKPTASYLRMAIATVSTSLMLRTVAYNACINFNFVGLSKALMASRVEARSVEPSRRCTDNILTSRGKDARFSYLEMIDSDLPGMVRSLEGQTLIHTERGRMALFLFARRFIEHGDVRHMAQALRQAGVWDSPVAGWFVLRAARDASHQDHSELADALYREASAMMPVDALFHRELSSSLLERYNDWDGAIEQYKEVVRLEPQSFDDVMRLAELLRKAGRWDEAAGWFQQARILRPENGRVLAELALFALNQGRKQEARDLLLEATGMEGADPVALILLASVYKSEGRLDEAPELVQRALRQDPKSSWGYSVMGEILAARGELRQAEGQVRRAIALAAGGRDEVVYLVQLADLYVQMGYTDEAIAVYRQALDLDQWRIRSDYIEEQLMRLRAQ